MFDSHAEQFQFLIDSAVACRGRIVVGFSGGLDSTVLLAALVRAGFSERLLAVHINHGLSDNAADWDHHCARVCEQLGVSYISQAVELGGHRNNIEAHARAARREALLSLVGKEDQLWLAHHRHDQAETVLLRLMRGAGSQGLAAMQPESVWQGRTLVRPLLSISREQLQALADAWQLSWVEDESNASEAFERNFIRLRVVPVLAERWPAAVERLSGTASQLREDAQLLDELAGLDLSRCENEQGRLGIPLLKALSPARQRNLLRGWIRRSGRLPPSSVVLQRVLDEVLCAAVDREPQVQWPAGVISRFRDQLYLLDRQTFCHPPEALCWSPTLQAQIVFGQFHVGVTDSDAGLLLADHGPLTLRVARGGERLYWRGMHRQVSELWRQKGLAPWVRRQLPLIYQGDQLTAVAAIGVADNRQPAQDDRVIKLVISSPNADFAL